jgi:anaerobic magnesium-protoporphyrin IX monomethyl ester cyclase
MYSSPIKILLVNPPKTGIKGFHECPPVGLGYLATALKNVGHRVNIVDCVINGWDNKTLIEYIQSTHPEVVGFNLFSTAVSSVKDCLVRLQTEPHKPLVVLGGPHVTGAPLHTMQYFTEAHYAIAGEGEIPIVELCEYLQNKRLIKYVHGLVWRERGVVLQNERAYRENLDDLGFPAWNIINPTRYFKAPVVGRNSGVIHFSRGCPFSCGFCVKFGTKVRWRTWDHIWSEINHLNKVYGIRRFLIHDEGFTMFPAKVKEFCRQVIQKDVKYSFFSALGLRLNRVDDEMLDLMRQAGFEKSFGVGIESAVERVRQDLINKHLTQEELENGLAILNRNGFKPVGNFILGYPGDTRLEMVESIKMSWKMFDKKLLWGFNWVPFIPLPGAPVVNKLIENGEFPKDFDFSQINSQRVLYAPKGMTIKELDDLRKWAVFWSNFRWRMILHFLHPQHLPRAIITFIRLFSPNFILPYTWKRR